jgi:hypothetical protein
MFARKTLVIVGAGASTECGLPTGRQLTEKIASLLDIRFEKVYDQVSGDDLICQALRVAIQREDPNARDINSHLHAARHIRDAMPQALSIDNFIDAHRGDDRIELCGKLAIARAILEAEQNSKLYVDPGGRSAAPNFTALRDTWFNSFFMLLTENCRVEQVDERMSSVAMIIFNYDRCIEHFLYQSLQNYYQIEPAHAAALIQRIEVFHPYGTVGWLPWQSEKPAVSFGAELSAHELVDVTHQIRTFTEGTDPASSDVTAVRDRLVHSDIVLFLGFAFHPLNLELLRSPGAHHLEPRKVRYYGTAKGVSESDREAVSVELTALAGVSRESVVLRDLTCGKLFQEYWRSLALSRLS